MATSVFAVSSIASGDTMSSVPTAPPATANCRAIAKSVYSIKGWRHNPDAAQLTGCPQTKRRAAAKRLFYEYRFYRQHAHEPGISGEGIWLQHLALPAYVVRCETNGYSGMRRYTVRGGGAGAYQIQDPTWRAYGGTRFAPTADQATPGEQADIAEKIRDDRGLQPWACA